MHSASRLTAASWCFITGRSIGQLRSHFRQWMQDFAARWSFQGMSLLVIATSAPTGQRILQKGRLRATAPSSMARVAANLAGCSKSFRASRSMIEAGRTT